MGRIIRWRDRDARLMNGAFDRALELLDLTLDDPRWRSRLSEIARTRELLCAAVLDGGQEYRTSLEDLDRYFLAFAVAARNARNAPSPPPSPLRGEGLGEGGEGEVDLGGLELRRQEEDG